MLFVLAFVVFVVALPAMGEVWSRGEDNVFSRSRSEVVVVVQPYLEKVERSVDQAKERLALMVLVSWIIRFAKLVLASVVRIIDRFTGG